MPCPQAHFPVPGLPLPQPHALPATAGAPGQAVPVNYILPVPTFHFPFPPPFPPPPCPPPLPLGKPSDTEVTSSALPSRYKADNIPLHRQQPSGGKDSKRGYGAVAPAYQLIQERAAKMAKTTSRYKQQAAGAAVASSRQDNSSTVIGKNSAEAYAGSHLPLVDPFWQEVAVLACTSLPPSKASTSTMVHSVPISFTLTAAQLQMVKSPDHQLQVCAVALKSLQLVVCVQYGPLGIGNLVRLAPPLVLLHSLCVCLVINAPPASQLSAVSLH